MKTSGRRTPGDGSLFQRTDDKWVATLELGWTPRGTRRRWSGVARTRAEALAKLRAARAERDRAGSVAVKRTTVKAWLDQWLLDVKPTVRPTTWAGYEIACRVHLVPRLGPVRLADLTAQQVREAMREIAKGGHEATAQKSIRVLSRALTAAEGDGLVPKNVARLVTVPGPAKPEAGALSTTDARLVVSADTDGRWTMALLTGARRGEVIGLEWNRVDLKAGTADLAWQLQRLPYRHGCGKRPCGHAKAAACPSRKVDAPADFEARMVAGLALTRPKTAQSSRLVPLPGPIVDRLRAHRGDAIPTGLVWTDGGKPIDPRAHSRAWDAMLARLGIEPVPLHSARRTTATLLMELGTPDKVIQELLGHTKVATTQMYQRADLTMARAALDGLGATLTG